MKKLIILMMCMILLSGTVSAFDFDNLKIYDDVKKEITINNCDLWLGTCLIEGEKIADIKLDKNSDQCLIDCFAEGTTTLYSDDSLFNSIKFLDELGENTNVKSFDLYVLETIHYNETIFDRGYDCGKEIYVKGVSENCEEFIKGNHTIPRVKSSWVKYDFEKKMPSGIYRWRIEAEKDMKKDIDWVVNTMGKDLDEWAWWTGGASWVYKKEFNVTGGLETLTNYPVYVEVLINGNMNTNFTDVRFVNAAEDGELNYEMDWSNGSTAGFWVQIDTLNTGANTYYMYYGNAGASSTSNGENTFGLDALGIWHFTTNDAVSLDSSQAKNNMTIVNGVLLNDTENSFGNSVMSINAISEANEIQMQTTNNIGLTGNIPFTIAFQVNFLGNIADGTITYFSGARNNFASGFYYLAQDGIDGNVDLGAATYGKHWITIRNTGTQVQYWVDDVITLNKTDAYSFVDSHLMIAGRSTQDFDTDALWDEYQVYNSTKPVAWILRNLELNDTTKWSLGEEQTNTEAPTVTLNSPANNTNFTVAEVSFNCTGQDDTEVVNLTAYVYNHSYQTSYTLSSSGSNESNLQHSFTLDNAMYNWTCEVTDNGGDMFNGTIRSLMVNVTGVVITQNNPVDNYYSNLNTINFDITGIDDTESKNITLWIDGNRNFTQGGTGNTTIKLDKNITFGEGIYNWVSEGRDDANTITWGVNRTLTIDTTSPIINITKPEVGDSWIGRTNTTNVSGSETLTSCLYSLNGEANVTMDLLNATEFSASIIVPNINQTNNMTVSCNDSANNWGTDFINWSFTPNSPTITITSEVINYYREDNAENITINWTVSDEDGVDSCWYYYPIDNTTRVNVTCENNGTTFRPTYNKNSILFFANDTYNNEANTTGTWQYNIYENSRTFNSSTYETANEGYLINATANSSLTAIDLVYGGGVIGTLSNKGGGLWGTNIDVSSSFIGNNSFTYRFTHGALTIESNESYQNVGGINFAFCNSSLNQTYLNISFKDEDTDGFINASIPLANFNYYLGLGAVNKTYQFINTSNNSEYKFCASPKDRTYNLDAYVQYEQVSDYPQRIWNPDVEQYSNVTINQTLYLLGTGGAGILVAFIVYDSVGSAISGVEVTAEREIFGEDVEVGQGTTDAAGTVAFWLNSNFQHTLTFTKEGYDDLEYIIIPTESEYSIIMGGESLNTTVTDYQQDVVVAIFPKDMELNNDTIYNFNMTVTSTYWTVDDFGFILRLTNGTVLSTTTLSSNGGYLSLNQDTLNYTRIYMDYYWNVGGNYTNKSTYWNVFNTEHTDYSINYFITDFKSYLGSGMFGMELNDNFGVRFIIFIVLFLTIGIMSYKYGVQNPTIIVLMIFGTVFLFDVVLNLLPTVKIFKYNAIPHIYTFLVGVVLVAMAVKEVSK